MVADFLGSGGEMGALIRAYDWAATPLGAPEAWPQALRTAIRLLLNTGHPIYIFWGAEGLCFYNDAYRQSIGPERHPGSLGQPAREVWAEAWDVVGPQLAQVMAGAGATWNENQLIPITRHGRREDVYWTYSYSPIDDEGAPHGVGGVLVFVTETTQVVLTERRQGFLVRLGDELAAAGDPASLLHAAVDALGHYLHASRVGYGEVNDDATITLTAGYADGVAQISGRFALAALGKSNVARLRQGFPVIHADILDGSVDDPQSWAAVGTRSFIAVPLIRHGVLRASLYISQNKPRAWLAPDVALMEAAASRIWDALERTQAEAGLRQMTETLEARVEERTRERDRIWNHSRDLLVTLGADGTFRAVNPAWTSILGHEPAEVVGKNFREFVHPQDVAHTPDGLDYEDAHRDLASFENRYLHRDGSVRWISWYTSVEGETFYAYGRDITAEKAAAAALHLAESRIRAVFETTKSLQGFMDAQGILLDANPSALAAIEAPVSAVAGRPLWETAWFTATPGMPEMVRAAVDRAAAGQLMEQEITVNLPTGRRSFDFAIRPIVNARGQVIGMVPEAVETTERRLAEEALRQSQKMEAVGQLTGGLAHDFNNLLTGIMGSLDLLKIRLGQGRIPEAQHYVTAAHGAATRAAALIQRLLAFSRRQTLDPKAVDINRLVDGMNELIRRAAGATIEVETIGAPGLWTALIDPNQLENALLNLCINARDAMPSGGRITIETANLSLDERAARQQDLPAGDYVSLCVIDTGTGMAPDVIQRAFDPFFTTKPVGEGTGLGLSMVYGFAHQSGGEIRIFSELGRGTTMCLYLPRHTGKAGEAAVELLARNDLAGTGRTVQGLLETP